MNNEILTGQNAGKPIWHGRYNEHTPIITSTHTLSTCSYVTLDYNIQLFIAKTSYRGRTNDIGRDRPKMYASVINLLLLFII